ncbi:MAG: S9 family peptidase [Thermoanaerobaculia bacterium]|nr:S9 family peptidase [Thermoanaerobaculia bacterium]
MPQPARATSADRRGGFSVSSFDVAPDGRQIVFERRKSPLITDYTTADLALLDLESKQTRLLYEAPGADTSPRFSPDGRSVLFASTAGNTSSDFYKNGQIWVIPTAGGEPHRLAADFDEDPSDLEWAQSGIYFLGWQRTQRRVFRIDPASGQAEAVLTQPDLISGYAVSPDGQSFALSGFTATTLPEIYRVDLGALQTRVLTRMTRQIEDWQLGTPELVSWPSQDGTTIEGVLHKPPGFDPKKRYPLLVVIHGGPTGIDTPEPVPGRIYPIVQWLAKGALVLRPNYRGSAGYGEAFRSLNVRNLGVGDAWDVLSGVDALVARGIVDPKQAGAMGWSQGGYISAYLTTTTDRFRAISVGAGISNWTTYYVSTDIHPFTRQYLEATPWDDPEIYARTSPMTFIKQARTPTLIQHGENDRRVPIPNAYELYQGLLDQGVEAKLVVYKGFGHGIDKPKELLAGVTHNWEWFARHLWGENEP